MRTPSLLVVAVAATVALGCAACSDSEPATSTSVTVASSAPPGPTHALDGATPEAVVEAARAALLRAPLVRFAGTVALGRRAVTLDVTARGDGQGAGWVSDGPAAGRAQLKVIGADLYIGGDDVYNRAVAGAAAVPLLHGRWVRMSRTDPAAADLVRFVDRRWLTATALQLAVTPGTGAATTAPATVAVSADGTRFVVRSGALTMTVIRDSGTRPVEVRESRPSPLRNSVLAFGYPATLVLRAPDPKFVVVRKRTPAPSAAAATRTASPTP